MCIVLPALGLALLPLVLHGKAEAWKARVNVGA